MNILHMKYAVEVARVGSLNKAAESLYVALPNISRSIRELEASLGITIFVRTAKGMQLTPDGAEFISYAKAILNQIEQVEQRYQERAVHLQRFSLSASRAYYISEAFSHFSRHIASDHAEILYKETSTKQTLRDLFEQDYRLGIVRFSEREHSRSAALFAEKKLHAEVVAEFSYRIVMSNGHPLAKKEAIAVSELNRFLEITHADSPDTSVSLSRPAKHERFARNQRKILLFEGASPFEILSENPQAFMWAPPMPEKLLTRYDLQQRPCADRLSLYRDTLVYRDSYQLSDLDSAFLAELQAAKQRCL